MTVRDHVEPVDAPVLATSVEAGPRSAMATVVTALRIVLSFVAAAGIAFAVRRSLPTELRVRTDVIGYPIHSDFNVKGYFDTFYCAALLFPALAFVIDTAAACLLQHRPLWRRSTGPAEPLPVWDPAPGSWIAASSLVAHAMVVGAVIGAGVAWAWIPTHFRAVVVLAAAAGASGALLLHAPWRRSPRRAVAARAVALAAPLALLSVAVASAVSRVQQVPSDTERKVQWLPVWVPLALAGVGFAWVVRRLRSTPPGDVAAFERRVFSTFAVPVGLFLFLSRVPGPLGPLDAYHEGEGLAAFDLVHHGITPWRELFFIHGPLTDIVRPGLGMLLVEYSRWGAVAGQMLLLVPIYWVGQYFLNRYLIGRNWVLLLGTMIAVVNSYLSPGDLRFLLHPFVLLALAALLQKASVRRALLFSTLGIVQWILTPESAFLLVACAATIVGYEVYYREAGTGWAAALHRTRWCAAFSGLLVALWAVVLLATGTLSSYLLYFRTFAPSHELTGGIPMHKDSPFVWFAALAPGIAAVLTAWWFGSALRTGRRLAQQDWIALAIALFTFAYYRKFLSRADGHVYDVLSQALPLIVYVVARSIELPAAWLGRRRALGARQHLRAGASLAVVGALVLPHVTTTLRSQAQTLPLAFRAVVPDAVPDPLLGYTGGGAIDTVLLHDLRTTLDDLNPEGGRVFDMSNGPALFYYVLHTRPISRYYHVSMAIRHNTQQDALYFLRKERPTLVVMDGSMGLPSWDGVPNTVRHYDLASYVLDHYKPVISTHRYVFFLRGDLPAPDVAALAGTLADAKTDNLLADTHPCTWGHAPSFFTDPSWRRGSRSVPLSLRHETTLVASGWAQDSVYGGLPGQVLAAVGENVVGTGSVGVSRPDVVAASKNPQLETSGFVFAVSVPVGTPSDSLRLYAVSADGTAAPLARSSGVPAATREAPLTLRLPSGQPLAVRKGTGGSVDAITMREAMVATFPDGTDPSAFTHLEIRAKAGFGPDTFEVRPSATASNPISFATDEDDGNRYVVRVDNCPMWRTVQRSFTITSAGRIPFDEIVAIE